MNVIVDLINATSESMLPSQEDFQSWGLAAIERLPANLSSDQSENIELCIRLVDEEESSALNESYRKKNGSTNILSFPFQDIQRDNFTFLGDLAICAPVVKREAEQQNKTQQAHWAHMTIHGVLHLNAYDHENENDADIMEKLEIDILKTLGYSNPY
jgi:probable rRNA maturation factor